MLPPESTATTGAVTSTAPASSAATPTAPAGSTTCLPRSSSISSAREMSSSETVTTSSTSLRTWVKVSSPGRPTAIPSAIVANEGRRTGSPARSEGGKAAALAAWTPITRTSGRSALATTAIPETSPPPPTPVTMVRTSGHCSRISSATVPCPAMTSAWSNGWMNTAPVRSAKVCAATSDSSTVLPTSSTCAPYPLVAATFGSGAFTGMKTVACAPTSPAASATPWAWLPALAATTPRARSSAERREIRTYAPRTLYDPARCRFSHLSQTGPPSAALSGRDGSSGVVRVTPPSSSRAA